MDNQTDNFLAFQYAMDAAPVRVVSEMLTNIAESDEAQAIDTIIATSCAIEMVSKDLHYRAKGKPFYGTHLLADLVNKIGGHKDDLNEIFYLGDQAMPPPLQCYVAAKAIQIVEASGLNTDQDETSIIDGLKSLCDALVQAIETVKKMPNIKAGVQAVLDNISADALQGAGLLHRTSTEVDIQASGAEVAAAKEVTSDAKPEVRKAGDNEVVTLVNAEAKPDETQPDETAAQDGFFGSLFNRSEASKKGWETSKQNGWKPGVWPKQGGSSAPAAQTPSVMSVLPKHLTRPKECRSEIDANRAMQQAAQN